MTIIDATPLVLVLQKNKRRVTLEIRNDDESLVDASEIELQVQDLGGAIILSDTFPVPPFGGRIEHPGTGIYFLKWGDPTAAPNIPTQTETSNLGKFLFVWNVVGPSGTEEEPVVQTIEIVSPYLMDMIREFRDQVDKAVKQVSISPTDFCPLGYTEGMLLQYLRGGLQLINAYQPYPTWCQLSSFSECFRQTLFDAAMVVTVNAQTLFAIDSDIESYSDQGNALVINHHPKLAAFSQMMSARLDNLVPRMKLHFVRSGSVKTEIGPSFRLAKLVEMSPTGATFRNLITRG